MPVILTVDGPSLGGFVCPATIPSSELWKIGQVRPHDNILFKQVTIEEAYSAALKTDALVAAINAMARGKMDAAAAAKKLDSFQVGARGEARSQLAQLQLSLTGSMARPWLCSWARQLVFNASECCINCCCRRIVAITHHGTSAVYISSTCQVDVPTMPKTKAVLVDVPATDNHPGYLVRLAGDR